jgi:hypothetical protein
MWSICSYRDDGRDDDDHDNYGSECHSNCDAYDGGGDDVLKL